MAARYHTDGIQIMDAKKPDDVLDYGVNFADFLAKYQDDDSIATYDMVAERGISVGTPNVDGTIVSAFFSGGTNGNTYLATASIVSVNGRTKSWSIYIPVGSNQLVLANGVPI